MKVAIITSPQETLYPVQHNTFSDWSKQVARRLSNSAAITLVGPRSSDQERSAFREDGVDYRFIRSNGLTYGLHAARIVRSLRCDIVHLYNAPSLIASIRLLNPGVPIVLHVNNSTLVQKTAGKQIRNCKYVFTNSRDLRDIVRTTHPQFADRIVPIYDGIDSDFFRPVATDAPKPTRPTRAAAQSDSIDETMFATIVPTPDSTKARISQSILFAGELSPTSGIQDVIDAFVQIAAHVPQATLEIVGDAPIRLTPYAKELKRRVPNHLKKRVFFRNPMSKPAMLRVYQSCALVVDASRGGGYNMSIAMGGACGKPAIVSNAFVNAGLVIDGETGFVVNAGDIHMLARSMGMLLHDLEEQARMGRNARVRIRYLYDWDEVAKMTLTAYKQVLGQMATQQKVRRARALG